VNIGDLPLSAFKQQLATTGLSWHCGSFRIHWHITIPSVSTALHQLYAAYPLACDSDLDDVRIALRWASWLRRWIRPLVQLTAEGPVPYTDVPPVQSLALLEWGMNWCIASRTHHLLMLHAAVLERQGQALILPASPGYGKSTLCAALMFSGWRLLSDEFGLIEPQQAQVLALPRPVGLKNESIAVIRAFAPNAQFGPLCPGTHKGTVAHLRVPDASVARAHEPAQPTWLVFPRWQRDSPVQLQPLSQGEAFITLATNAFNYEVLGATSFTLVGHLAQQCACYTLQYSDLAAAITHINAMTQHKLAP
jgi:HprK-related kinase A